MWSSISSSSSLSVRSKSPFFYRHTFDFSSPVNPFPSNGPLKTKPLSITPSISNNISTVQLSWSKVDSSEEYNGWAIDELDTNPPPVNKKSLPTFVLTGIGASVTVLLGLLAYFSISSKGFKFRLRSPLDALHGYHLTFLADKKHIESQEVSTDVALEDAKVRIDSLDELPEAQLAEKSIHTMKERTERVIVPLAADHTQEEAMLVLKKLKIIEDDARSDELCTRRQYARWLMLTNSLERSRKHRLISSAALSGSGVTAFDDVQIEDPDFEHIQSLAESGVIRSKLSIENSGLKSDDVEGKEYANYFSPERFISREDLINWKARIEYQVMPGITEQMSRTKIGFLDVKAISADVLVDLFIDVLADEKSILRAVFGQSKRLQPSKPCTKGQAAVALTRGRMAEFIQAELLKQEAEIVSKQIEVEEILKDFLERGEIKQFWERKLEEEKKHGFKVDMDYQVAIDALEQEKITQENASAELVKQRAALDCQRQLLSRLRTEVDDMSERVAFEKANCIHERHGVEDVLRELLVNYEELLDKKSVLEAEVEALRKLRSWVEDEATKSQARAKVLEEAARRWKWDA